MHEILQYFPHLTEEQKQRFALMNEVYRQWNAKINVISRRDIDNLYSHHILHSLALSNILRFKPGTRVMDLGTGGGFPGIPLAVLMPDVHFHLIDSIGKKIHVCNEVVSALNLQNVTTQHTRAEEVKSKYHFVVSRAVMPLPDLVRIVHSKIDKEQFNAMPNGLLCLKGGDLQDEIAPYRKQIIITSLAQMFPDNDYFQTKHALYLSL